MRRMLVAATIIALLGGMVFAGGGTEGSSAKGTPLVMGALIRNLDDQFLSDYTNDLRKAAEDKGVTLKVMDAHSDLATQLTDPEIRNSSAVFAADGDDCFPLACHTSSHGDGIRHAFDTFDPFHHSTCSAQDADFARVAAHNSNLQFVQQVQIRLRAQLCCARAYWVQHNWNLQFVGLATGDQH